jgi:N-acetylglucosaminyldiphosphoundecaprenol N-acetyl-beta-D-mannosaminyltransferase
MSVDRINVLGVGISALNMNLAAQVILDAVRQRRKGYVCVTNVHAVMEGYDDPQVRAALNGAMLCTPDGMPMVWLGRWAGKTEMRRVYGPDLMLRLCADSCAEQLRHFFYGGANGAAAELAVKLKERFPSLIVAGTYEPPFRPLNEAEERQLIETVRAARPDLLWVGLSTPKQDKFMAACSTKLDATVMLGVGAAFDFHSGRVRQAPAWLQRLGLEWFFRLCMEPRRLWKRYLKHNPRFVYHVLRQKLGWEKFPLP